MNRRSSDSHQSRQSPVIFWVLVSLVFFLGLYVGKSNAAYVSVVSDSTPITAQSSGGVMSITDVSLYLEANPGDIDLLGFNPSDYAELAAQNYSGDNLGIMLVCKPTDNQFSIQAIYDASNFAACTERIYVATSTLTAAGQAGQDQLRFILGAAPVDADPVVTPWYSSLEVEVGETPLVGADCIDPEDGDISSFVSVSGYTGFTTAGIQNLTYSCTDSGGNTVTADQVLTVTEPGDGANNDELIDIVLAISIGFSFLMGLSSGYQGITG